MTQGSLNGNDMLESSAGEFLSDQITESVHKTLVLIMGIQWIINDCFQEVITDINELSWINYPFLESITQAYNTKVEERYPGIQDAILTSFDIFLCMKEFLTSEQLEKLLSRENLAKFANTLNSFFPNYQSSTGKNFIEEDAEALIKKFIETARYIEDQENRHQFREF